MQGGHEVQAQIRSGKAPVTQELPAQASNSQHQEQDHARGAGEQERTPLAAHPAVDVLPQGWRQETVCKPPRELSAIILLWRFPFCLLCTI